MIWDHETGGVSQKRYPTLDLFMWVKTRVEAVREYHHW